MVNVSCDEVSDFWGFWSSLSSSVIHLSLAQSWLPLEYGKSVWSIVHFWLLLKWECIFWGLSFWHICLNCFSIKWSFNVPKYGTQNWPTGDIQSMGTKCIFPRRTFLLYSSFISDIIIVPYRQPCELMTQTAIAAIIFKLITNIKAYILGR